MSYAKYANCPSYPALCEAEKFRARMKARKAAFAMLHHTRKVEALVAKCEAELGSEKPKTSPAPQPPPAQKPKYGARKAPARRQSPVEAKPKKARVKPERVIKIKPSALKPAVSGYWDGEGYVPVPAQGKEDELEETPKAPSGEAATGSEDDGTKPAKTPMSKVLTLEADEPPKPPLENGSYWDGERYVRPDDPDWTTAGYEEAAGRPYEEPPPGDPQPEEKPAEK
jgi:hypothetical protein